MQNYSHDTGQQDTDILHDSEEREKKNKQTCKISKKTKKWQQYNVV